LENHYQKITLETAEPFEFSPAEPVDYGRFSASDFLGFSGLTARRTSYRLQAVVVDFTV
jgi:hypothetical protein